jgi:hypothetical protein
VTTPPDKLADNGLADGRHALSSAMLRRRPALIRSVLLTLVPVLAAAVVACDPGTAAEPPAATDSKPKLEAKSVERTDPPAPTEPRPSDPTPDPITHPCVVKAAQFDVALDAADNSCKTDADCDCYPGGVTPKAGCGGVTSASAAKELHRLAQEFRADGCDWTQHCAPRACEPNCVDGSCR